MLDKRFVKTGPCDECNLRRKKCKDCGNCSEHCRCSDSVMLNELALDIVGFYDVRLRPDNENAGPHEQESFTLRFRHRRSGQSVTLEGLEIEQLEEVALTVTRQRFAGELRRALTEEYLRSLPVQDLKYVLRDLPPERLREITQVTSDCLERRSS